MKVVKTLLPDVLLFEPVVTRDARGFLFESFQEKTFEALTGIQTRFVQENHVFSKQYVLRGLHFQPKYPQGKLIRVLSGAIWDVAVDLRKDSPYFGQWVGVVLSSCNHYQLWIPPGFAHGFLVLSKKAECLYKMTDYWQREDEKTILWCDQTLQIHWHYDAPLLSSRDKNALSFQEWLNHDA